MLYYEDTFREINNTLGIYFKADTSYQESEYMGSTRIHVGLELSKGMIESIIIIKLPS
jgi:hypothetical protein